MMNPADTNWAVNCHVSPAPTGPQRHSAPGTWAGSFSPTVPRHPPTGAGMPAGSRLRESATPRGARPNSVRHSTC